MKKYIVKRCYSITARWLTAWLWLIEPSTGIVEPERRLRARMLMAMLFILLSLGLLSLIMSLLGFFTELNEPKALEASNRWITVVAILLLAIEYGISRTIHYEAAAVLAVATVLGSVFVVVIISPTDLQYLFFLVLGGLIASLFLSARATAIVFLITIAGLLLLPIFVSGFSTSHNIYALFFVLTVGGLVVLASILRQRYLEQIDWQTQRLVASEKELRELSIRDPLTGMFNRRYLEETLTLEMRRAARHRYPIGIIMADIDHFKRFNDTYGHAAGDAVLIEMGKFFRTHIRSSDVACRYGGEEFLLILPEASLSKTQMRAEQLREDARRLHSQIKGQVLEAVTLSLGVAVFPDHGSNYDELLDAADAALYRAKRDGRDRVVAAD